jgi:hypothetical protein
METGRAWHEADSTERADAYYNEAAPLVYRIKADVSTGSKLLAVYYAYKVATVFCFCICSILCGVVLKHGCAISFYFYFLGGWVCVLWI